MDRNNSGLNLYVFGIREALARLNVPPHAATTPEIEAAFREGLSSKEFVENFALYYRQEVASDNP